VRRSLAVALAGIMLARAPTLAEQLRVEEELAAGIQQVEGGDLEAAVATLKTVVERLRSQEGRAKDLGTAHLYLAVAHLGLGRSKSARAEMREAWRYDQAMVLDPTRFSARVIQLYDETRQEAERPSKKGGSKALPILLGVGAAAGAGVALAGRGQRDGDAVPLGGSITLLAATPPGGSSVRLVNNAFPITLTFAVQSRGNLPEAYFGVQLLRGEGTCSGLVGGGGAVPSPLQAGQTREITVRDFNDPAIPSCFAPAAATAQTDTIRAYVVRALAPNPDRGVVFETRLSFAYTLVR